MRVLVYRRTEIVLRSHYKRKYGMTWEQRDEIVDALDSRCEICGTQGALNTDHCHTTKRFRGMLCTGCNVGLGMFKDSISSLENAKRYLEKFPTE